jgi:hypothetical protein
MLIFCQPSTNSVYSNIPTTNRVGDATNAIITLTFAGNTWGVEDWSVKRKSALMCLALTQPWN